MSLFKNREQTFQIRDGKGIVYNTVKNPAVLFDKSCGTLFRIGEKDAILVHFNLMYDTYVANGFKDIAEDLVVMDLPKDQEIIDDVFQITGYVKRLYERALANSQ